MRRKPSYTTTFTHSYISGCGVDSAAVRLNGVVLGYVHFDLKSMDHLAASPGYVDSADITALSGAIGSRADSAHCFDYNDSGYVDSGDVTFLAGHVGHAAPSPPSSKPSFSSAQVSFTPWQNGERLNVDVNLNEAAGALAAALVIRPDSDMIRYADSSGETGRGDVYSVDLIDEGGPKVVIILLNGALESASEKILTLEFDVLDPGTRENPTAYLQLEYGDMCADDRVFSVSTSGKPARSTTVAPTVTQLHPNVPNPFNPITTIEYSLSHPGDVSLKVYDVSGRLVRTLVVGWHPAGNYHTQWNGVNDAGARMASGIYIYRMQAGDFDHARKLVLLK